MRKTPSIMRKMYLFLLLVFAVTSGARAQELLRESVFFETDQHQLTAEARHSLNELLKQTVDLTDFHLQILAFTDDRGTTDYNYQLALRRGNTVQAYLQELGLMAERSTVESLGEIALEQADEQQRSRNRRVDLVLTAKLIGSLSDLWQDLARDRLQEFTLEPGKGSVIEGKAGTKVWIPANALAFADGRLPSSPITFRIKESYAYSDMIIDGLSTHSDDRLLETGGMVYLEAEAAGQKLALSKGQEMAVSLPTEQLKEGMQLFMGEQSADGQLSNWTPTRQAPAPSLDEFLLDMPSKPILARDWIRPPKELIDYSKEPRSPRQPIKPNAPSKPRRESVTYYPGALNGIFMSKAKRKKKEEEIYAKKLKVYETKMEKYRERSAEYQIAMVQYETQLDQYKQAHKVWEKNIREQKSNFKGTPVYQAYLKQREKSTNTRKARYDKEMVAWYELRDERMSEYEAKYGDALMKSSKTAMQYLYRVNRMGWINCDRFYNVPDEERVTLAIADEDEQQEELFVIFKDIKSMMKAYRWNEESYQVANLPKDMEIRVVGIKVIGGKAQLAVSDTRVRDGHPLRLSYQPASINKIRAALQDLDS